MNTPLLATAGLAGAVDFFTVAALAGVSSVGLGIVFLAWRLRRLWPAVLGTVLIAPPTLLIALEWLHAMRVSPAEDMDAAGFAPMWGVGLIFSSTCFVGGCLCILMMPKDPPDSPGSSGKTTAPR
jgi:hypothetical protein